MPKSPEVIEKFNNRMVRMYPNVLYMESSTLFCKLCHCNIKGGKKFNIKKHFRTLKHQTAQASSGITEESHSLVKLELDTFGLELCTTFLEANVPLERVDNPTLKNFLLKYIRKPIPKETALRTECVPALYTKYVQKLRDKFKDKSIWVSLNGSIDKDLCLEANFIFGVTEERGKSYLLNVERLERANASSWVAFFNTSLQILWPDNILYDNVHLAITDENPSMTKAMQSLKILYPNMIHINCFHQSLDRLVQFIRMHFSLVDSFIIKCEAVFLRSPHRLHLMRSKYNYLNLPSSPTASTDAVRTWLNVVMFYCDYFKEITAILEMLSAEDDDECIQQARELIQNPSIHTDLIYLKQNFESVSRAIIKLKNRNLSLDESLETVEMIKSSIQDTKRPEFIIKFEQILNENPGLQELSTATDTNKSFYRYITYKFAPIVSSNVEHLSYARNLLKPDKSKIFQIKVEKHEIDL